MACHAVHAMACHGRQWTAMLGKAATQLPGIKKTHITGAGGITHWIQDKKTGGDVVVDVTTTELGKCVANVGGAAHGLFSAAAGIKAATKGCAGTDGEACATDVLNVISVLSNIGSAVAHITDQCTGTHNLNGAMTGDILKFVSAANAVATAGMAVDKACTVSEAELAQAQIVEVQVPAEGLGRDARTALGHCCSRGMAGGGVGGEEKLGWRQRGILQRAPADYIKTQHPKESPAQGPNKAPKVYTKVSQPQTTRQGPAILDKTQKY